MLTSFNVTVIFRGSAC